MYTNRLRTWTHARDIFSMHVFYKKCDMNYLWPMRLFTAQFHKGAPWFHQQLRVV